MSVPAHKHTRSLVRSRRSHDALKTVKTNLCSNCGAPNKSHTACSACGFYNGRQVIKVKADLTLKRQEKKKQQEAKEKAKMAKLKNS